MLIKPLVALASALLHKFASLDFFNEEEEENPEVDHKIECHNQALSWLCDDLFYHMLVSMA